MFVFDFGFDFALELKKALLLARCSCSLVSNFSSSLMVSLRVSSTSKKATFSCSVWKLILLDQLCVVRV